MLIVRIFFQGLIAFVPAPHQSQMTALLVDSKNDSAQCIALHHAELVFPTADARKCTDAGCTWANNRCTCEPKRQTIAVQTKSVPAPTEPGHEPIEALPLTKESASDMAYVVNMSNLGVGYDILRSAVTGDPGNLVARMAFPYTRITSCDLATDPDTDDVLHSYDFHPFGAARHGWNQPLAQGLVVEAEVASGGVSLVLAPLGTAGGSPVTFDLTPTPCGGGQCIDIQLSNMRPELRCGDPCNNGIGRDFAFYYDLATVPPPFAQRPIPNIDKSSFGGKVADIQPVICPPRPPSCPPESTSSRVTTDDLHPVSIYSHPVCAMAVFYPSQ